MKLIILIILGGALMSQDFGIDFDVSLNLIETEKNETFLVFHDKTIKNDNAVRLLVGLIRDIATVDSALVDSLFNEKKVELFFEDGRSIGYKEIDGKE